MPVRPFTIDVPQAKLDRIWAKLLTSEIGYTPDDDDAWKYGADARYLAEFRDYWLEHYDWRVQEAELNRLSQYKVRIEDLDIHFYHLRSERAGAFPLILSHGWPGSAVEFQQAMPLLAEQGYDVVVPSLPGFGFSSRPSRPIGTRRIAAIWRTLMIDVLGYSRFGAQGGDWGSGITLALGREHSDVVASIHVNILFHLTMMEPSAEFRAWRAAVDEIMTREGAYMYLQRTKPQTIGLALADSPIGFAAWVLEKCNSWADAGGNIETRFSKDQLITNIMTYLVNDAVQSAIWLYYGSIKEERATGTVTPPLGFASFPAEFVPPPPREAVEEGYNLVRWSEMGAGGHFAAWEEPEMFAREVGAFFRDYR